jgi:DNA-binding response OmpR family regulator|tara:strand:+ start:1653 stop:2246 length:594 start_codon:yes stop_codon:yes gene_type:complete
MLEQKIHIINFKILFDILEEIKSNLSFEIIYHVDQSKFIEFLSINNLKNSLILTKKINSELKSQKGLDKRQLIEMSKKPVFLPRFIEDLNINLIKQNYNFQSNINIKNYFLNFNSRILSYKRIQLKLTQKEIDIILFLNQNTQPQNIDTLQSLVWKYESDLETHTVETHIYRLRKKIKEQFNDDNFIISGDQGYFIE